MFYLNRVKQSRELLFKCFNLTTRHYTNPAIAQERIQFFTKLLELPDTAETETLLKKHRLKLSLKDEDFKDSLKCLLNIGITVEEVRTEVALLNLKDSTLFNRYEILLECGCPEVSAYNLNRYLTIANKTECSLKSLGIIPQSINLQDRLARILNVKLKRIRSMSLKAIRWHILKLFYAQNGIMKLAEFDELFKHYHSGRHMSYRATKEMLELALDRIKMPKKKLKNNFNILSAEPENVRKLLSMEHIGGVEMERILRNNPHMMKTPYESVQKVLTCVKDFGFTEETVARSIRVLSLSPETVCARLMNFNKIRELQAKILKAIVPKAKVPKAKVPKNVCTKAKIPVIIHVLSLSPETVCSRLMDFNKIRELQVMKGHPQVLNLIVRSSAVAARMEYMKLLNVKCFSLSILTGTAGKFVRYGEQGEDKSVSRHCITFLSNIFQKDMSEVKKQISRHAHWLKVSIFDIKQTIDELQKAGFSLDDIYPNIHIVLYSSELIFERLKILIETEPIEGIDITNLTKTAQLKMVLYAIEVDHNFTGNGVWAKRETVDRLELSDANLPDVRPKSTVKKILYRGK